MASSTILDPPRALPPSSPSSRRTVSGWWLLGLGFGLTGMAFALDGRVAGLELRQLPDWESFAEWVSFFGEGWVIAVAGIAVAVACAFGGKSRAARIAVVATLASLLAGGAATLLRTAIGRTRPHARAPQGVYGLRYEGRWVIGKYDFASFPSGHTATVVGLAAALWVANRRAGLAAVPYAGLVAWSRLALGHHHFSDIVGATVVGIYGGRFFAQRFSRVLLSPASGAGGGGASTAHLDRPDPEAAAAAVRRLGARDGAGGGPLLSVVTPCYNEEGNLRPLAAALAKALEPLQISWELVVVDDRSRDQSWAVLGDLAREDQRIRGLRLARNSGQSAAIWAGIRDASGRFIATMDADLQNVPDDLPILLAALEQCDCACGTRVANRKHGDSLTRRLSSRIANGVRNWLTRETVTDSGCCYRVFRRECAQNLKFFKGMHRFLPTLMRIEGFQVAEVPITHHPRLTGHSHYGVWDRLLASSYDLLAVRWMQRRMFPIRVAERVNLATDRQ